MEKAGRFPGQRIVVLPRKVVAQALEHLLGMMVWHRQQTWRGDPDPGQKISQSIAYMKQHLEQPLLVSTLAALTNLRPRTTPPCSSSTPAMHRSITSSIYACIRPASCSIRRTCRSSTSPRRWAMTAHSISRASSKLSTKPHPPNTG